MKNIGIVLSPSLVIPTSLLSVLLSEFQYVFALGENGERAPIDVEGHTICEGISPQIRVNQPVSLQEYLQTVDAQSLPLEHTDGFSQGP